MSMWDDPLFRQLAREMIAQQRAVRTWIAREVQRRERESKRSNGESSNRSSLRKREARQGPTQREADSYSGSESDTSVRPDSRKRPRVTYRSKRRRQEEELGRHTTFPSISLGDVPQYDPRGFSPPGDDFGGLIMDEDDDFIGDPAPDLWGDDNNDSDAELEPALKRAGEKHGHIFADMEYDDETDESDGLYEPENVDETDSNPSDTDETDDLYETDDLDESDGLYEPEDTDETDSNGSNETEESDVDDALLEKLAPYACPYDGIDFSDLTPLKTCSTLAPVGSSTLGMFNAHRPSERLDQPFPGTGSNNDEFGRGGLSVHGALHSRVRDLLNSAPSKDKNTRHQVTLAIKDV